LSRFYTNYEFFIWRN